MGTLTLITLVVVFILVERSLAGRRDRHDRPGRH
jgi:hypothetical protein